MLAPGYLNAQQVGASPREDQMEKDMKTMHTPLYRIAASALLFAAGSLFLHSPVFATEQGDQRKAARL